MHDACRLSRCMMATAAGVREGGIDSAVSHPLARRISCGDYEFVSFILHVLHIYKLIRIVLAAGNGPSRKAPSICLLFLTSANMA
jgi:hypothetical protein